MRIEVTEEHIKYGVFYDARMCPIALVMKNKFPEVRVGAHFIWPFWYKINLKFELPQEAKNFIDAFDSEMPVAPFSFDIDIPDELSNIAT